MKERERERYVGQNSLIMFFEEDLNSTTEGTRTEYKTKRGQTITRDASSGDV